MDIPGITVASVKEIDKLEWDNLVKSSVNGTAFICTGFLELQDKNVRYIVARNGKSYFLGGIAYRIRGAVPILGYFARSIWLESGPIVRDSLDKNLKKKIKLSILNFLKEEGKRMKVVHLYTSHWTREEDPLVFKVAGYEILSFASFLNDLTKDVDTLFANLKKKNREAIRQGKRAHVKVIHSSGRDSVNFVEKFYHLRKETQKRAVENNAYVSMLLKSKEYITKLLLSANIDSYLTVALYKDKIVTGTLSLGFGSTIYAYIAGSDFDLLRQSRAANILYWELMNFAKEKGYKLFDWGGAPVDPGESDPAFGVYKFKKSFNGRYTRYYGAFYAVSPLRSKLLKYVMSNRRIVRFISRFSKIFN